MRKTITIQIGNSDDKLSQQRWSEFVTRAQSHVRARCHVMHFFGASAGWERWQNAAWVIECDAAQLMPLQHDLAQLRDAFGQDSIAWTEGETLFI